MPHHPETLEGPSQAKTSASTNTLAPWDPIRGLSKVHMRVIELHVDGMPNSKIAYQLKRWDHALSGTHIRRIIESPTGRHYASLYSAHVHGGAPALVQAFSQYAPAAAFVEAEIMLDPLEQTRHKLNAAQDVMDRAGPPKISRQENENKFPTTIIVNLLPSQLSALLAPPPAIEAEYVVLNDQPSTTAEPTD